MAKKVDELRKMLDSMTEAEANIALRAVSVYRAKVDRPQGVVYGAFDVFFEQLDVGQVFSAADVIRSGVSTSRAYARLKELLEQGWIEQMSETRSGMARQPATYKKCKKGSLS